MRVIGKLKPATKRITTVENRKYGVIFYDEDNAYPQRILQLVNSSPTAKSCVETYSRFIGGEGFKDPKFYKAIANTRGQTMDRVVDMVKQDVARFRGFAIHFNVTAEGKISGIHHVPFEHVRLLTDAKRGETGCDYAIYKDWAKAQKLNIKSDEIQYINRLELDSEKIIEQIAKAGDTVNYKGQLLYHSFDDGGYPLASCDAVLEAMYAEIQSDITTTKNIENNFTAKGILVHKGKFATDDEAEEFEDDVAEFIGPEGSSLIVVDVSKDEEKPEFIKIDSFANDKIFEYTDRKVREKIVLNWMIPKVLMSISENNMFSDEQFTVATKYYNMLTVKERLLLEETFKMVAENFELDIRSKDNDYSISLIEFKIDKSEIPVGLLDFLQHPSDVASKRAGLEILFGINPEDAARLVPDTAILPDTAV